MTIAQLGLRHITTALRDVFHAYVPRDPEQLYRFFEGIHLRTIQNLMKKGILKQDQIDLLLPPNKITDSSKFDFTLICVSIINFTSLRPPANGWKRRPYDVRDISTASFVVRARDLNDKIMHMVHVDQQMFSYAMDEMRRILIGLRYKDMDAFEKVIELRTNPQFIGSVSNIF